MEETVEVKKTKKSRAKIVKSCGLLIFRDIINADGRGEIQYLIVQPYSGGGVTESGVQYLLPNGKRRSSETEEEAAIRVATEDTGIRSRIVSPLEKVRYGNGRKEIELFLAKFIGGTVFDDGRCLAGCGLKNDDIRFVPSDEARKRLRQEFVTAIDSADELLKR